MPKAVVGAMESVELTRSEILPGDEATIVSHLSVRVGWDKGLPEVRIGVVGVNPTTGIENVRGPYTALEWSAINQLIHDLREARDQAFGRPA